MCWKPSLEYIILEGYSQYYFKTHGRRVVPHGGNTYHSKSLNFLQFFDGQGHCGFSCPYDCAICEEGPDDSGVQPSGDLRCRTPIGSYALVNCHKVFLCLFDFKVEVWCPVEATVEYHSLGI
jgi:hypothetical protein